MPRTINKVYNTSKNQRLAQQRNSAKWSMLGTLGKLRSCQSSTMLTQAERMQLGPAIHAIEVIMSNWNESNTEFGLKNPDLSLTTEE
jgi:hypothetical protein